MTTAARPTFLPALGGHSLRDTKAGPQTYKSARELNAHLKLKLRKPIIKPCDQLLQELKEKEDKLKDIPVLDLDKDDSFDEESDLDESSDEDDTAELLKELEKIKQERLQEKIKLEQERALKEEQELEEQALTGNPLLNVSFNVKRRWDDDVIFKNQASREEPTKKRFINDMLRSDFHRKFMNKYVQ